MRYNTEVIGCVIPQPGSQDAESQDLSHIGIPEINLALGACKAGRHMFQGDNPCASKSFQGHADTSTILSLF